MRVLLKLLFLLISIVAIVLIVGLFVDGDFSVSREVTINQPKEATFEYLATLSNQQEYGVWQRKDPNIRIKTTGIDGTVGFISSWDSTIEEVGAGEQEITEIIDNKLIATEIRFKRPMKTTSQAYLEINELSNTSCSVGWKLEGRSPYPWNVLALFMDMDKEIGPDLKKSLQNLKSIMESKNK